MAGASEYNLEPSIPPAPKLYSIDKIPNTRVDLRHNAYLELAYVSLHSLVGLYRQRGDVLFDKNIRLSLVGKRQARERLVNPMEETLDAIATGQLSSSIFPFYHIGVTLAARSATDTDGSLLNIEAPSVINGCQTISIANEYLRKLEKQKNDEAISRFRQVKVIAKVVIGTTSDELKEITNANNRQNPIENWQLFSNDPIHIEIEAALKDIGIFYERQEGKFDTLMKNAENARNYPATNGTYVTVVGLGQVIALSRGDLSKAAKPSDVFVRKKNHDEIFDRSIPSYPRDIVFLSNLFKAVKRGLYKYLELPSHANSPASEVFDRPMGRAQVFHLALLYYYQHESKRPLRIAFSENLTKIANQTLVADTQTFYQKVVAKIKNWYTDESKNLTVEVSRRRMDEFFAGLATETGVDATEGAIPFTEQAIDWSEYEPET
jgi:hypothetical protein